METKKYQHAEAFHVMEYECRNPTNGFGCGAKEKIWNSRDGVTPFTVDCPQCKTGTMFHHNWQSDIHDENYKPLPGQRIFRDGRPEEARECLLKRWESMDESFKRSMNIEYRWTMEETRERVIAGALESEFQQGWPMIEVVA